jgi:3-oxoacyl-[acyl-carrier protein] reductase
VSVPTAIVTGASRGIGAAISVALAKEGLSIALLGRDIEALRSVEAQILAGGGSSFVIRCDLTERASVDSAFSEVYKRCPAPTVLVNNAGVGGPFHLTTEVTDEEWDLLFATNVRSAFWFCREFLPAMKRGGFGRIVNIASIYGLVGGERSSSYAATKHALIGYTRSIAREWGPFGITSNAICPGFVMTDMHRNSAQSRSKPRLGPVGTPVGVDEVVGTVLHLTRPQAAHINGAAIVLDGGLTAGFGFYPDMSSPDIADALRTRGDDGGIKGPRPTP